MMLTTLLHDLRTGARALRRSPGVTLAAVAALALGIGANSAIFTFVDAILLQPLPYRDASSLVAVFAHETRMGETRNPTSPADFLDWRDQNDVLDRMTAAHPWAPVLTGEGEPARLTALRTSPDLFRLLGVEPALGRVYGPGDDGHERIAVLGDSLWRSRFGSDRSIVGRSLTLDGEPYEVVGVMPPGFEFPPFWQTDAALWVPRNFRGDDRSADRYLRVFARLRPGVSLERARDAMSTIARRLEEERPETNAGIGVNVERLREPTVGGVRRALLVLFAVVGLVLLIALANVASLLLARGLARGRELGVRAALGATRGRLLRQLLVESLLLSMLGGAAGLLLGTWGVELLRRAGPETLPRLHEVRLDARAFGFTFGLALASGLAFGALPAFRASRVRLGGILQAAGRGLTAPAHGRLHRLLVAGEVALALVVLIGAGLLGGSLLALVRVDPGFEPAGRTSFTVSLAGSTHGEPQRQARFLASAATRVESIPGVRRAAWVNHLPIGGDTWRSTYVVEAHPETEAEAPPRASFRVVSPGYFQTMGIALREGGTFDAALRPDAPGVVVVGRELARRYWPDGGAVGSRLRMGAVSGKWLTVVGVAADVRQRSLAERPIPEIYLPYAQNPVAWWKQATLVIEASGDPATLGAAVKERIWDLDPALPVSGPRSLQAVLGGSLARQRFQALLLAAFAAVALTLAVVGIYGLVSYSANRRVGEIGLRMALGARRRDVLRLVVGQGMLPAAAGIAAGLAGAALLGRLLGGLLFGVEPTDVTTYAAVSALLAGAALLASLGPAVRATRIDPVAALRRE